ncbi:translocase of chloroplast 120, chloroplastic-like [Rutidosis leptorrhynchoides]|uniref:translocase of chloroplast 120, chloroplastic-like n=1 Tax=Rutidosis leptorrhynchoides TaxID=125765 RepID=UPI003A99E2F1
MENGASEVKVQSKVDEMGKDDVVRGVVNGNGINEPFKDASNGVEESVSETVVVAKLDESVDVDQEVVEKFKDAFEASSEIQTVRQEVDINPVEEDTLVKVMDLVSTSGNTTRDQDVVIESNKIVDSDVPKENSNNLADTCEEVNVADCSTLADVNEVINSSMNGSNQEPSGLEVNEVMNDEETIFDTAARDQVSELETDVSEIGGKGEAVNVVDVIDEPTTYAGVSRDEPNGLEDNGIVEDKKPATAVSGDSNSGDSDNVDVVETVVHEDGVNGDFVGHRRKPDGEIDTVTNGNVTEKGKLVTENNDGDSINKQEKFESLRNSLLNEESEPTAERSLEFEKGAPKDSEMKQDVPVKKEAELKPVIGVSLSAKKSSNSTPVANPKHDPKPDQSPIPNSKPTAAPTPAPSPAPARPAGLPRLEPAHRVVQSQANGNAPPLQNQVIDEPTNGETDENDDTREKLQMIRVKFLRLARRLGQTPHNVVVAQVLYRLGLAEQLRGSNGGRVAAFSFERASAMAEHLEAAGQEPLEFSCTIMVLGKTGVGKSATINSIFDEVKFETHAFQHGTKKVQDVVGTVQGIKVRVIDTPGLHPSWADQKKNEKILHSVKRFIQKTPPDIVLYLDRLDMQSRDSGDMALLRTITDVFGQSIWFNAIVVLTHAASAPPEGPNGVATSYDMFVTQRSHVVQQAIRQAAGDMRLMNPVSLVENHSACRTNRAGQRVLPNGQVWKPHLLLLSFASKILVEANMLLKLQDSPPGKPFGSRSRAPPLPFILSNLLQSRPQLKLPDEQFGDDDDGDDVMNESSSSDEESYEYDELPPFKRLSNSQISKLSKSQKKSYYDELEYRERLFMKKQLKEEKKRRRMMKKMAETVKNVSTELTDNAEEDGNGAGTVPVAVQDMNLPVSFDADNPTHRYRALDSANQWLVRPVLDPHGWDHDVGYEGINVEHLLALKEKIPASFSGQVTKDKKDANLQMEVSSAMKHGKSKSKSTTLAFDMQTVGKEMSYTLRSDTRFINYRKNKASVGFSGTHFGDSLTGGVKFEDKLTIGKRGQLVVAGGAVLGRGDVAYGGSFEATIRDKDYPLGRFLSTIGLSVMDWHGDLAIGWNAQSQIPIGRFTNLIGRVNLNNKGSGQVSVRLNSSEQLQIALVALVPLVSKLLGYYQDRDSAY